eukprot:2134876-Amphidinium_carterae.1
MMSSRSLRTAIPIRKRRVIFACACFKLQKLCLRQVLRTAVQIDTYNLILQSCNLSLETLLGRTRPTPVPVCHAISTKHSRYWEGRQRDKPHVTHVTKYEQIVCQY